MDLMNPLVMKILGATIRAALMLLVPFLVSQGYWTTDEATATMTTLATALAALLLSYYEKYRSQRKVVTALAMPKGSTQADLADVVATGATPPVTLSRDIVPYLPKK